MGVLRDDAVGGVPDAEGQSHRERMVTLGWWPWASSAARTLRRSSDQKWPDSMRPAQGRHSEKGGPGRPVEVGVRLVAREGHGPVLLDRRLVGVQELAVGAPRQAQNSRISRAVMPRCSQPLSQIASKSESTSGRGSCSSSASCLATQSLSFRAWKVLGRISEPL